MRNASDQRGENERQWKKKQKGAQETKYFVSTCDIVFIKGCNSEEVSCCSHAKQRQGN